MGHPEPLRDPNESTLGRTRCSVLNCPYRCAMGATLQILEGNDSLRDLLETNPASMATLGFDIPTSVADGIVGWLEDHCGQRR